MNKLGFLGFLGFLGCLGFLRYLPGNENLIVLHGLFVLFFSLLCLLFQLEVRVVIVTVSVRLL